MRALYVRKGARIELSKLNIRKRDINKIDGRMVEIEMSGQKMIYIGNVKEVPVGEAKKFLYPVGDPRGTARPGLLIHLEEGFVAYDGLCTHLQAEVDWNKYSEKIWCTLHDGMYDPKTGRPFMGMPKEPLKKIELKIEENGDIYAVI